MKQEQEQEQWQQQQEQEVAFTRAAASSSRRTHAQAYCGARPHQVGFGVLEVASRCWDIF